MNKAYTRNAQMQKKAKFTRSEIPTCFRQKTIWTVLLDYALTAASVIGLLTALLFIIVL